MNPIVPNPSKTPDCVVVIVSNGPGELTTWVKPVAKKLKEELKTNSLLKNKNISLRLILVPCPNATGQELKLAKKWKLFEKVTSAKSFWKLLINPNRYAFWPKKGIVVFLGGDQFWNVLLSARLKYKSITYAEWIARWPFWNDRIAAMSPKVEQLVPKKYRKRCVVVGDLMADIESTAKSLKPLPKGNWIALLPGSKRAKLVVGVPFFLAVADHLYTIDPEANFLLPLAPTTNIQDFLKYSSQNNPIASKYSSGIKEIQDCKEDTQLKEVITNNGTKIKLIEQHPAHGYLSQCDIALTTVGANTAELGALAIPMIVIIPTQHLAVMQAWDGLLGIIGRMPLIKRFLGLLIYIWRMRKNSFLAWPNITANRMIVPERIGKIYPVDIAKEASEWINSKEKLLKQKEDLRYLRGQAGAVNKLSNEILDLMEFIIRK